ATAWMWRNRQPLVTSDYILDELLTLLKIRENYRVAVAAGEALWQHHVRRIEHVTLEDIARTWEVFRQDHDKDLSFTDCTTKVIMERLRMTQAFAFDSHFEQFGTVIRVP